MWELCSAALAPCPVEPNYAGREWLEAELEEVRGGEQGWATQEVQTDKECSARLCLEKKIPEKRLCRFFESKSLGVCNTSLHTKPTHHQPET